MPATPRCSISGWAQWWPVRMAMPSWSSTVPTSCGWTPASMNERIGARASARAEAAGARDRGEHPRAVREQRALVGGDGVEAERLDVVDGRAEPDHAGDVGRAGLEALGRLGVDRPREARPSGSCRRRPATAASPRAARACRRARRCPSARTACAREAVEVAVERAHVDAQVRHRLRPVDHHRGAARVREARRSRAPASTVPSALETWLTRHDPRPRREQRGEAREIDLAARVERDGRAAVRRARRRASARARGSSGAPAATPAPRRRARPRRGRTTARPG